MNSKSLIFLYILLLATGNNPDAFAQTIRLHEKPASAIPGENDEGFSDTLLKRTLAHYQNDSLQRWKHSREFAYVNYLDSLLRTRHDIKADTVSMDQNSGKIKRSTKSGVYPAVNKFLNSLPVKIFFWALACAFIGLIFYKIFYKNSVFTNLKNKSTGSRDDDLLSELPASGYEPLIKEAERLENFNLSVRYLYLQTLTTLSEKGLLNTSPGKTNSDYLEEMASSPFGSEFALLTRSYEYLWYGKFHIEPLSYQKLKNEFILFNKKVQLS